MASTKNLSTHAVLVAAETGGYGSGTPALVPNTDGFLVSEPPEVEIGYQNDGSREGRSAGGFGLLGYQEASGRKGSLTLPHYFRGPGTTGYATSAVVSSVHTLLRMLGMVATYSASKWDYTPGMGVSGVLESYVRAQRYALRGAYCKSLDIEAEGKVTPVWKFGVDGIMPALPTDASPIIPTGIVYPNIAQRSPKAAGLALGFSNGAQLWIGPRVSRFSLRLEREIVERENQQATGGVHGGFALGALTATLDVVVEAETLVTASPWLNNTREINPYAIYDGGLPHNLTLGVGTVAGSRYSVQGGAAYMTAPPKESANGPVAQWDMSFRFAPLNDAGEIDLRITTD